MDKEIQLAPNDGEDLGNEEIGNSIKVLKSNIRGMKRVIEPLSKKYSMKPNQFIHLELLKNKELKLDCHTINDLNICQIGILLNDNNAKSLDFSFTNRIENEEKVFILDELTNNYIGPLK